MKYYDQLDSNFTTICINSFVLEINISQNSLQDSFTHLNFHKVNKIASVNSYKTLKLWEIHVYIFMTVSIIYNICENLLL